VVYQALLVAADFADLFEYPDDAVKWRAVATDIAESADIFFDPERKVFRKGFLLQEDGSLAFDNTLDVSSLYGPMTFGLHAMGAEHVKQTMQVVEQSFLNKTPSGGSVRYEYDNYFATHPDSMGNPWIIATLWIAQYYIRTQQLDRARDIADWAMGHALHSGMLPEQINPDTGYAVSVTPLVWSHAEFVNTLLDLSKIKA
jgi:GH15 family glucan-1,4-alpha-glucosidase